MTCMNSYHTAYKGCWAEESYTQKVKYNIRIVGYLEGNKRKKMGGEKGGEMGKKGEKHEGKIEAGM